MTWRSFMDYVLMVDLGQSDAIARNYDLEHLNGSKPGVVLDRAFARMGFDQVNTARAFIVPIVAQRMRDCGYSPPMPDEVAHRMRCWHTWDRIRAGELIMWPMRRVDNPLI